LTLSPRPGVLLIRYVFNGDSGKVKAALAKHNPGGIATLWDQPYRANDGDAKLDVYFPETTQTGASLPTLVWTHGGAWISGDKEDNVGYFQLIASKGYTVVSLNYSLGPDETYPTAVHQINDALAFLQQNAGQYHIDVNAFFIAGDSAGAQLTSQIATLVTSPAYAQLLGVTPALKPAQLRGVVLACGIYDLHRLARAGGILGWGNRVSLWAYTGSKKNDGNTALDQMSTLNFVTADFPPLFITGGNDDPLTDAQSKPLAGKLTGFGVDVVTLFYPPDHEPKLGHEYQFKLDLTDGMNSLDQILAFMAARR
jgi:acetyl esterase